MSVDLEVRGGTTTAICLASQFKGHPIGPTLDDCRRRARGALDVVSSDHCGYCYEGSAGKGQNRRDANFRAIPNGIPGLAARLPIVFSEGVGKGRITASGFAAPTIPAQARLRRVRQRLRSGRLTRPPPSP